MYIIIKDIFKKAINMFQNSKKIIWKFHYFLRYKVTDGLNLSRTSNFHKNVRLLFRNRGTVSVGESTNFQRDSRIVINGGHLKIGNNCSFGEQNILNVFDNVIVGNNVLTADRVNIISNIHIYNDISIPISEQKTESGSIIIGDGTWLGVNCTILPNTVIGKNCVIGANAVVKGFFKDYSVIAGVPAKVVKFYDVDDDQWKVV